MSMPELPQVLMTDYVTDPVFERQVLDGSAEIACLDAHGEVGVLGRVGRARVIICFHDAQITRAVLQEASQCVGVVRSGVGFNNIDIRAAGELGIVVCNVPDYGTEEVADHALGLLLALARRIVPSVDSVRRGEWSVDVYAGTPRLRGQTVGIIGAGRIGTAFAIRVKTLGMRVVIYDPYVPRGHEKAIAVERVWALDDLLPQCQFLSLHCPLTDETRNIVDAHRLAQLPRGAYVVNTARGGLIDENALLAALDTGHVAWAALDVVEREPLADERMRRHPRLVVTPHCAFYSTEAAPEMRSKAAQEALRLLQGQPPRNPVNLAFLNNPRGLGATDGSTA
jgi:D-3-phosphoglycerate dehydrogenase